VLAGSFFFSSISATRVGEIDGGGIREGMLWVQTRLDGGRMGGRGGKWGKVGKYG
jgi:hypothetical protein